MATTRRELLRNSAAAALAASGTAAQAQEKRKIVLGMIGPGGMGTGHLRLLTQRKDVEIAAVCDPDRTRLAAAAKLVETSTGKAPKTFDDMRRLLEDPGIEAVFIATPDHWHAPAAILALDAGKHVYVEKPCCHNIREGRLMIEAAKRTGKLLQVGTQSRSTPIVQEAIARVRRGEIGEILVAKAWNSQLRRNIGKSQPAQPPADLNYDLWVGPAPMVPYRSTLLPGIWRWWYDFGCGDIGNDGVHDIDVALWGLGVTTHPSRVACMGGKYFFDDDQQFPDTQYAVFEYPNASKAGKTKQLIYEQRIWSPYVQEGYENGAAFYGTNGVMIIGHAVGWKLYGPKNQLITERTGQVDLPAHHSNFFDCIRGQQYRLNAPATDGVLAASICHLANISARLGRMLEFDPEKEVFPGDEEATRMVRRKYRKGHWAAPRG
jgi:predicted dehydrogenase